MRYLSFKKISTNIVFYYPILYMAIYMLSDSLARRLAQFALVLFFVGVLTTGGRKTKATVFLIASTIIISLYNLATNGIAYIMSLDYYGWILLILVFRLFTNEKNIQYLENMLSNEKKVVWVLRFFYILLLMSIVFFDGLRTANNWGISVTILYGPYEIPHGLAYTLSIMYLLASVLLRKTKKRKYFFYMIIAVVGCIWTGARSGILAMTILVIADYFSVRKATIKIVVPVVAGLVVLYLGLFTDLLLNNPFMQKNMDAFSRNNLSNGRGWFNSYLIDCYIHKLNPIQKVMGIGLKGIRNLMHLRFGTYIHAHNDLLNTLVGFGFFGIVVFIKEFLGFVKNSPRYLWLVAILLVMIYYNGLYMYVGFSVTIPLFVAYFRFLYGNNSRC